jgi:DNA-binding transcriptional regulator YhcF (GntR family)
MPHRTPVAHDATNEMRRVRFEMGDMRKRDDVTETLRQRVASGIHFGTLAINTRLPSARRLARELHACLL